MYFFNFFDFNRLLPLLSWKITNGTDKFCRNGLPTIKIYNLEIVACSGRWNGHISSSNLCGKDYHLCNKDDKPLLSNIHYNSAIKISGCYAFNAAQDHGRCINCENRQHQDDMGGIGKACPLRYSESSCISGGRIDAMSHHSTYKNNQACRYHSRISGVLCCKN